MDRSFRPSDTVRLRDEAVTTLRRILDARSELEDAFHQGEQLMQRFLAHGSDLVILGDVVDAARRVA